MNQHNLLEGQKIMVVEDDYLLAFALAEMLTASGADVIGPFGTVAETLSFIEEDSQIDAAILEVDLHGEKSFPVAKALAARHVRFVFATGYGADGIDREYRIYPCLQKPIGDGALFRALRWREPQ